MEQGVGVDEPDVSPTGADLVDVSSVCTSDTGKFGNARDIGSGFPYHRLQASDDAALRPTEITIAMWVYVADPLDVDINVATWWPEKREKRVSTGLYGSVYALGANHGGASMYWPRGYLFLTDSGWVNEYSWSIGDQTQDKYDYAGWHHAGMTFTGGRARLYLNGDKTWDSVHPSGDRIFYHPTDHGVLNVGKSLTTAGYWPGRLIDDLAIYDEVKDDDWFVLMSGPPGLVPVSPTNLQSGVAPSSSINFQIYGTLASPWTVHVDRGAGWELALTYDGGAEFAPRFNGPSADLTVIDVGLDVTLDPIADFNHGQSVQVKVTGEDAEGDPIVLRS
jgi:hypothetical protein